MKGEIDQAKVRVESSIAQLKKDVERLHALSLDPSVPGYHLLCQLNAIRRRIADMGDSIACARRHLDKRERSA